MDAKDRRACVVGTRQSKRKFLLFQIFFERGRFALQFAEHGWIFFGHGVKFQRIVGAPIERIPDFYLGAHRTGFLHLLLRGLLIIPKARCDGLGFYFLHTLCFILDVKVAPGWRRPVGQVG